MYRLLASLLREGKNSMFLSMEKSFNQAESRAVLFPELDDEPWKKILQRKYVRSLNFCYLTSANCVVRLERGIGWSTSDLRSPDEICLPK